MNLVSQPLQLQLAHTWTIARASATSVCPSVIVQLQDRSGARGIGEAAPTLRYNETSETVQAFLKKIDPSKLSFSNIDGSMRYLHELAPGNMSAKCAVNIALLDGAARIAGKPIHDFLGLGFTENKHLTSFTIGIDTPDVIRKKVQLADPFPILKIKVGMPGEKENLKALREVAPTKEIRVDANEGWKTKEEALEKLHWLKADGHVQFVEQPLPATTPAADWHWLKSRSPLPIFADESYHTSADISQVTDCFHGVNVKLVKTGGISEGFHALNIARTAGLMTMIGCMIETSVLISAAAHLANLCDYLDLDGNILITNDPYQGVTAAGGRLSFAHATEPSGLRVAPRN